MTPFASFAEVLRLVGRGPTLSRPLEEAEAEAAMAMILDGRVEPAQLGGFLLVLRYRTETAAELAGFVRACRARLRAPELSVDLDWPSYADRHKQLPYFLLAALLLAEAGIRVLLHGIEGEGPATTPKGLEALGIRPARTVEEAGEQLERCRFAYLPLAVLLPELHALFGLRPELGLRTAVHTLARELNPFRAPAQIQGIFHPTYLELHRETQKRLGQPNALTFKGGGGEAQRNPDKPTRALWLRDGGEGETVWPAIAHGPPHPWRREELDCGKLLGLWRGEWEAPGPEAAVVGTAAMALWLLGQADEPAAAEARSRELWRQRSRSLPRVA